MRPGVVLGVVALALLLAGCGGSGTDSAGPRPATTTSRAATPRLPPTAAQRARGTGALRGVRFAAGPYVTVSTVAFGGGAPGEAVRRQFELRAFVRLTRDPPGSPGRSQPRARMTIDGTTSEVPLSRVHHRDRFCFASGYTGLGRPAKRPGDRVRIRFVSFDRPRHVTGELAATVPLRPETTSVREHGDLPAIGCG